MTDEILVSAASSLTDVFTAIGAAWATQEKGAVVARFNFASSGALFAQIKAGAPVDVFAAASPVEMDTLAKAGRLVPGTRRDFASNRLVLIAPTADKRLKGWSDLAAPNIRHLAVSDSASVPSGRYARETLTKRGLWNRLQPRLLFGENVRQTLAYVAAGDADAGIVFRTDALREKRVRLVAEAIPNRDHTPIHYPVSVVAGTQNETPARRFIAFLATPQARCLLSDFGFMS